MAAKFFSFIMCALLISIAAAAPAIDNKKFKEKCKELGSVAQMEAFRKFSASRFREGDYLKIQCTAQPEAPLEEQALYLGEERLLTQTEGKNVITTTRYITAQDRSKELRCEVRTAPTLPDEQVVPSLTLTYTYINSGLNVH